jgi:ABC-2 type transport system permease protein
MLHLLLAKDLRRKWRNPLPLLLNLVLPLAMTALIGLAFGGRSESGALGRIRFGVVDEDQTILSDVLRGASSQRESGKYLEPVLLEREAALRQINENKLSAVLIIPEHFTRNYLTGRETVTLELIKNPAESIHPAVLEELLGVVVTALNAVARNFRSEFPEWQAVFEGKEDFHKVSALIERAGDKLNAVKNYVNPPLVSYTKDVRATELAGRGGTAQRGPAFSLFAFLLIGLTGMFLLFIGSTAMGDLQHEVRWRTFERYQAVRAAIWPFVAGKVVFTLVILLLSSLVMLGGGGLVFGIRWQHPLALAVLTLGYGCFVAPLMALLAALVPDERRAAVLNNLAGMGLGIAGGCAFPPQQLPAFLRDHITPLLPSFWFADAGRNLALGDMSAGWHWAALKLAGLGLVLVGMAALLFRRRFQKGVRA